MKELKQVTEKTGLQAAAMIWFVLGTQIIISDASTENKIIGSILMALGISIMLFKYKREADRGVKQ